jgi:hypothetical protein
MAYALHLVPHPHTREVLVSLFPSGSLGAPIKQRTWPNCPRMLEDLAPVLGPRECRQVKESIAAGQAYLLPRVSLTEAQLGRLGL